jgi:hypothetical protein
MRRKRPKKRPAPRPKRCAIRDGSPESRLSSAPPAARTFHSSVRTTTSVTSWGKPSNQARPERITIAEQRQRESTQELVPGRGLGERPVEKTHRNG